MDELSKYEHYDDVEKLGVICHMLLPVAVAECRRQDSLLLQAKDVITFVFRNRVDPTTLAQEQSEKDVQPENIFGDVEENDFESTIDEEFMYVDDE